MMMKHKVFSAACVIFSCLGTTAMAETPDDFIKHYAKEAGVKDFSSENGKKFYLAERTNKKGEKVSCAGCHTKDPTKSGKTKAGKVIEPMAVSANKERFTDKAKVEKWFKRNCQDVYERACTPQEKGDYVSYMKSAK